jgi:hypothetical protein
MIFYYDRGRAPSGDRTEIITEVRSELQVWVMSHATEYWSCFFAASALEYRSYSQREQINGKGFLRKH